jgi:hypothetical protein
LYNNFSGIYVHTKKEKFQGSVIHCWEIPRGGGRVATWRGGGRAWVNHPSTMTIYGVQRSVLGLSSVMAAALALGTEMGFIKDYSTLEEFSRYW